MGENEKLLLENKFLKDCTLEERCFFKQLDKWLEEHNKSAKRNKEKYWSMNKILIMGIAITSVSFFFFL